MKYFIAVDEDLLLKIWVQNPELVRPFSRPFFSREQHDVCLPFNQEAANAPSELKSGSTHSNSKK